MTPDRASAIQSANAKKKGGQVAKGSFPARAQKAGEHNVASGQTGGGPAKGGN
jgi:hypothetical protein